MLFFSGTFLFVCRILPCTKFSSNSYRRIYNNSVYKVDTFFKQNLKHDRNKQVTSAVYIWIFVYNSSIDKFINHFGGRLFMSIPFSSIFGRFLTEPIHKNIRPPYQKQSKIVQKVLKLFDN